MILSALLVAAEACGACPKANPVKPMTVQRLMLTTFRTSVFLKLMLLLFPPSYSFSGATMISISEYVLPNYCQEERKRLRKNGLKRFLKKS